MHIFVTGEIQVGKSTLLRKAILRTGLPCGGFETYYVGDRRDENRCLYMGKAGQAHVADENRAVVRFVGGRPVVLPGKFDEIGCALLGGARKAPLLLMDECGRFEKDALLFHRAVLKALDESIPVLGVVRLNAPGLPEKIIAHPNVQLFTVTRENRDALLESLTQRILAQAKRA